MATILISSPDHDEELTYGRYYLRLLARLASTKGNHVIIVGEPLLYNFEEAIEKYDPDLVILNGHGGRKSVGGYKNHIILGVRDYDPEMKMKIVGQNPGIMKGRTVYLFSCFSAIELGPKLVKHGAKAVAGYGSSFIFKTDREKPPDERGEAFFTAALQLPILLAQGASFGEGCSAVRKSFLSYVEEYEEKGDLLTAKYLWHNYLNFKCFGNMGATIR